MKIAYQGIPGAYSQQVAELYFSKESETIPCEIFEEVFVALENNTATHAIVPVENTIAGSVIQNFDHMEQKDISISGEFLLPIKHVLLGKKGTKIEDIKLAHSHPVALAQCKKFLKKNKIKGHHSFDTAGSAQLLAQSKDSTNAAIASELCAQIYNLDILARDIQDTNNNLTRFLIIVKKENKKTILNPNKTSIVFRVKHEPGSLVQCLQRFQKHDVNLTKLESRPIPENNFEYSFFVDFLGGTQDENVKLALQDLEAMTTSLKILGSYKKAE